MSLHLTTLALAVLATWVSALHPRQDSQASAGSSAAASSVVVSSAAASSVVASSAAVSSAAASAVPSGALAVGDLDRSVNISIDGTIFPPPISPLGAPIQKDLTVSCIDCSIVGEISVSGGGGIGHDIIQPPAIFQNDSGFDFSDIWVGAAINNLSAHFEFAINVTASNNTNEFTVPLYSVTKLHRFDKLLTLTATFNPEIHGWVNTTNDVNFTHGFDFEVQPGSGVLIPVEHLSKTSTFLFNQSTLTPLRFTSTTGDLEMNLELSFRPQFLFSVDVLSGAAASVDVNTYFDVPKLDVQVTQVHNANSTCDPAPSSLAADQIFTNLTNVIPSIGFDAAVAFTEEILGGKDDQPFNKTWTALNLSTACLAFNPAAKTLGPAAQAKPSQVNASGGTNTEAYTSAAILLLAMVTAVFATF